MKTALAALTALIAATAFAAPAAASDRFFGEPGVIAVQDWDRDRGDRDDWRGRDGWRERRDFRRDGWDDGRDALSERQVARRLIRQGFVRIEDIDRRRDRFIVRAVRPNGALIRLAVDAYDGSIIARERIGWVAGDRGFDRDRHRPASGIEFDLGNGTLGVYSR